jgi:hypothetical protein
MFFVARVAILDNQILIQVPIKEGDTYEQSGTTIRTTRRRTTI